MSLSPNIFTAVVGSGVKYNMGCGARKLAGYINVDINPNVKPDLISDVRKVARTEDNSADEIMAVHVVEHFYLWEVEDLLTEWKRILKPGGKLVIECPNIQFAAGQLAAGNANPQLTMWCFWGDPSTRDPYNMHKWGYTPETLAEIVSACGGFERVSTPPAQFKLGSPRDFRVEAYKC